MSAEPAQYQKIIVRDLELDMFLGIHEHEKKTAQRVIVNVECYLEEPAGKEDINTTVNYEDIIRCIKDIAGEGHIKLAETFAEDIAERCKRLGRMNSIMVRIEKPDIIADTLSVGVEISR